MGSSLLASKRQGVFVRQAATHKNRAPRISMMVVFTLCAFVSSAVVLATQTTVPELARATAEITTLGRPHQVQSVSSGIVSSVTVQEGQQVEDGQVLASLVSPELDRDIFSVTQQHDALVSRIEILASILTHLDAPASTDERSNLSIAASEDYARSRVYLHDLQKEIARNRAESLEEIIAELQAARTLMQSRVREKEASVARLETLFQSGSITRLRLDAEQQSLDELRGRLIDADIELATNKANYSEIRDKPLESDLTLREQTLTELFALQQERDTLLTQIETLEKRREDLLIRAPVNGVIQAVDFPHVGEVIEAGRTLFELVNTNERLVAEIKVGEADIGHIRVGDAVAIKLTTYDPRRYGEITGRIETLSPNVLIDQVTGEPYFRGVVRLDRLTVGQGALEKPLRVGISGNAEIVTDERNMMAYLAKPIHRSLQNAFGER